MITERMAKPPRSTFLTVLCVLTFLGGAYGLYSGISSYVTAPYAAAEAKKQMEKSTANMNKDDAPEFAKRMIKDASTMMDEGKIKNQAMGSLLSSILTLLGGILMFRQNAKGFWIYVVGTLVGIAVPFVVFGNNMVTGFITLIPGIAGLAMIIMYAFNLKDMKEQPVYD